MFIIRLDGVPVEFELYPKDHLRLVVNWTLERALNNVTYEIQVSRSENFQLIECINVSIGYQENGELFHTWTWTSKLPLQCVDHSVRMRCIYNFSSVCNWSSWHTLPGAEEHNVLQMFPYEEVLQEGTELLLCCVAPRGAHITSATFDQTQYPLIHVSSQVRAIAVAHLNTTNGWGVSTKCYDSQGNENDSTNYVTFLPQKPKNLSCETEDLRVWNCTWQPGRPSEIDGEHVYTLLVQDTDYEKKCEDSWCSFQPSSFLHDYNVTVLVTTSLGHIAENIRFPSLDRVFPVANSLSVKPNVTEAVLSWTVEGNFTKIPVVCQVQTYPEAHIMDIEQIQDSVLRFVCQLECLKPSTQYRVKVRCGVSGKTWGRWNDTSIFTTYPVVVVDVWRTIKHHSTGRSLVVVWKTNSSGSQSDVESYDVRLQGGNVLNITMEDGGGGLQQRITAESQTEFLIGQEGCSVSVRAIVRVGSSIPSLINIPPSQYTEEQITPKRLVGSGAQAGFALSWAEEARAVCGYTVEWCHKRPGASASANALLCHPSELRWEKVEGHSTTSLSLPPGGFVGGFRYAFSVFGCREDGYHLIETLVGYSQEHRPTTVPEIQSSPVVTSSSVRLKWSFPEDSPQHPGFITGYLVTVKDDGQLSNQSQHSQRISVDDPGRKMVMVSGLRESARYSFCIQACTTAGPGPHSCRSFETSPDYTLFMAKILIPLAFLLGCCVLLWPHWKRVRNTLVEIFTHTASVSVKIVELDSSLYETSERIRTLKVEECLCCDLEVVDMGCPRSEERPFLLYQNDDSSGRPSLVTPPPGYCCGTELLDDLWDDPHDLDGRERCLSDICNFTYSPTATEVSFVTASFSSDTVPQQPQQQPQSSAMMGYVTSAAFPSMS
ncbi:leukemia inhibitory factor receptor [Engraulis encrasicolus]|uniref:leukemia inhibitory factor receptor n=1 Tax=Engraulis encrasicolus TaxID=184585 RepID=UPI002FD5E9A1